MKLLCPYCNKECETESELQEGQHVLCPFCGQKFSYQSKTAARSQASAANLIMAVCPYCGFGEQVDVQYAGQVGTCSKCRKEFTIMPNARGIPFQPETVAVRQSPVSDGGGSSDGVLGFLLGLILGIFGVLIAVLIDKKKYLKASLWGLVANLILGIIGTIILVNITVGTVNSSGREVISVDIARPIEEEEFLKEEAELVEKEVKAFTKMSRDVARKVTGASEALSDEEGANARKAVEAIDRDRLRSFDE